MFVLKGALRIYTQTRQASAAAIRGETVRP
jgi:hypothetical protein